MPRNLKFVLLFVTFSVGFLFGIYLDSRYRPNHIQFEVQGDTQEVNIAPRVGDTISWYTVDNGHTYPVAPRWYNNQQQPCEYKDSRKNDCTVVKPPTPLSRFLYTCQVTDSQS